jgi:AraC-like DNA-binding protein
MNALNDFSHSISNRHTGVSMMYEVKVNDKGCRIGQYHLRAVLTDHEVELIRSLHEDDELGYSKLADKFGVSKSTIAKICQYNRRNQFASATRMVYE